MADELGLLVWSEIPVYWLVDFARPETLGLARRMLAENIARDRNRASIILWSVGNETPQGEARLAFLRALVRDVRALDDSRLVTAALLSRREGNVQTIDDPLTADLDVMAVNTYNGWYGGDRLADVPAISWRSAQHKPLIFSELGAEALAGFHDLSANPRKFSEEYQAEYYRATLAMADRIPFLQGHVALDPQGFPLAAAAESALPAGLEPQGPDLRDRPAQARLPGARRLLPAPRRTHRALTKKRAGAAWRVAPAARRVKRTPSAASCGPFALNSHVGRASWLATRSR